MREFKNLPVNCLNSFVVLDVVEVITTDIEYLGVNPSNAQHISAECVENFLCLAK